MATTVDFVTNCFERDYRDVLSAGFMPRKTEAFRYPFRRVIVTVNNVADPAAARRLARAAVDRGDVAAVVFVDEALPAALRACGLSLRKVGRVRHFVDFLLVAVTCTDADHVLYCGAEVNMVAPFDWVTGAVAAFARNDKYLACNPSWVEEADTPADHAVSFDDPYHVSQGFSDQLFLARRAALAAPVYEYPDVTNKWYPMQDVGVIFEARVHHYMANAGLYRITDSRCFYKHVGLGSQYYVRPSIAQRIRRKVARVMQLGS